MSTRSKDAHGNGSRPLPTAEEQLAKAERKQKQRFEEPLPGYLFSLMDLHEARSANYLRELFKAIPEDTILTTLPPSPHELSGKGRPPFPRKAMLRALVARQGLRIPSYAALALRLQQDIVLRHECGFVFGKGSPGEDCLEDFAHLLGTHTEALGCGFDRQVDELSFLLPEFGESTSWDSAHIPLVKPPQQEVEENEAQEGNHTAARLDAPSADESATAPPVPLGKESGTVSPEASSPDDGNGDGKRAEKQSTPCSKPEAASPRALEGDWGKKTYESVYEKVLELKDGTKVTGIEVKKETNTLFGGKIHLS